MRYINMNKSLKWIKKLQIHFNSASTKRSTCWPCKVIPGQRTKWTRFINIRICEKNIELCLEKINWKPTVIFNAVSFRLQTFAKPTMYKTSLKRFTTLIELGLAQPSLDVTVFLHTEGRGWYDPLTVSPLIELELREKKWRCRPLQDTAIGTNIKCLRSTGNLSI